MIKGQREKWEVIYMRCLGKMCGYAGYKICIYYNMTKKEFF